MGEFSDLVNIRNEYYEYTDEVCEIVKNHTQDINEAFLFDLLQEKLLISLDNEYPLTNLIVLRITHHEIVNYITDSTYVNIRRDISEKIVSKITGKSAIKTLYSGSSEDIKRRRAMMNMIDNYMHSMYLSEEESHLSIMEGGIMKSLLKFKNSEKAISAIEISSHKGSNPKQGIVFTITVTID